MQDDLPVTVQVVTQQPVTNIEQLPLLYITLLLCNIRYNYTRVKWWLVI